MQSNRTDTETEPIKHKLTLGIDKNVIEKAKAAGINISAITENVLKAITYQPNDDTTRQDVARAYDALFKEAWSLLAKYTEEFHIDVGILGPQKICIHSHIGLSIWDVNNENLDDRTISVWDVLDYLYEPMKILENLILDLTKVAQANTERIGELKFALRLVKTLSDEEEEEDSQTSKERRTTARVNRPLLDMSDKKWCISTNEYY